MGGSDYRCSDASDARGESIYGTASHVRKWILLEQPGSWGSDALFESGLPQDFALELKKRARAARTRVILIRRGVRLSEDRRHCFFIRADENDPYMAQATLDSIEDLLDFDFDELEGTVAGAELRSRPLFLVCTHGKHDACCSIKGNLVSRVACNVTESDAWECSHIGGDRFAANLVCFPDGVYYGRVGPLDVDELMNRYGEGELSLQHYRGRCCYPFRLQAAEYFVRNETDLLGVRDLTLIDHSTSEDGVVGATFGLPDARRAEVKVQMSRGTERFRLTCQSTNEKPIPHYELISCSIRPA